MKEVAEKAGVSVSTVSHVLNKTRHIAPQTERRVLEAIQELKYYKNVHARRLAQSRSDLFGLVISEIANPFFPDLISNFQTAVWNNGFDMLLCNTEYDASRSQGIVRKMIESKVRGVAVMTSMFDPELLDELTDASIPVVISSSDPPHRGVSNIRVDYSVGISQSISHLMQLGHRQFAVIMGPQNVRSAVMVEKTILRILRANKITPAEVVECNYRVDGGASAVRRLLSRSAIPTAILCGNDLIAMGAMSALEEAGLRVPQDISVVGVDDLMFAGLARPPLTTTHVPRDEMGRLAFDVLQKMLRTKRHRGSEYVLKTNLMVRKSTAPPGNPVSILSDAAIAIAQPLGS